MARTGPPLPEREQTLLALQIGPARRGRRRELHTVVLPNEETSLRDLGPNADATTPARLLSTARSSRTVGYSGNSSPEKEKQTGKRLGGF